MVIWLPLAAEQNPKDFDFPLMGPALGTALLTIIGFPFLLLLVRKCTHPYPAGASLLAWDRRYKTASVTVTMFFGALIAWQFLLVDRAFETPVVAVCRDRRIVVLSLGKPPSGTGCPVVSEVCEVTVRPDSYGLTDCRNAR
jgi:hypothetical protein